MIREFALLSAIAAAIGCAGPPPASAPAAFSGLAGHARTTFTLIEVPASTAAALLPPELELAPQTLTASGQHLLLLQRQVVTDVVGAADAPIGYDEAIIGVPLVQLRGGRTCHGASGPFTYWPILMLDNQRAVDIGRNHYGYNKYLADVTVDDTRFDVDRNGAAVLRSTTSAPEPLTLAGLLHAAVLTPALNTPVIGRYSDGTLVWSAVTMSDIPSLSAVSVDADVFGHKIHSQSINDAPLGSVQLDWDWTLSAPAVCPAP